MAKTKHYYKTSGAGLALAIATDYELSPEQTIILTPTIDNATEVYNELKFFLKDPSRVKYFPDWETLPYDSFSPQAELVNKRLQILTELTQGHKSIYVAPIAATLVKIMPKSYFMTTEFNLKVGQEILYDELKRSLTESGYNNVEQVLEPGEYATRGSLIDLFPSTANLPYRIDLFGDEIESIKIFEPESQRTINAVDAIKINGANEYPLAREYCDNFKRNWQQRFKHDTGNSIYINIKSGKHAAGAEYFLPLFFNNISSFFSYIADKAVIYTPENNKKIVNNFLSQVNERHKQLSISSPCLRPDEIYLDITSFTESTATTGTLVYNDQPNTQRQHNELSSIAISELIPENQDELESLANAAKQSKHKTLITCSTETKKNHYCSQLAQQNLALASDITSWQQFISSNTKLAVITSNIERGFILPKTKITVITEADLVHHSNQEQHHISTAKPNPFELSSINTGDYVVHDQYGIGQYLGLTKLNNSNDENEYLKILYANDDKLYIPVTELASIYNYKSATEPELAKLGSKRWQNTRKKAIQKMIDSATEILELYSKRNLATARIYQKPDSDYHKFVSEFPYTDTPDQAKAIAEIIDSLCSKKLTDRLICGDVGFGKTEIAMRAAFLAVLSKLQVVLIAPTTLLASQHYSTFCERFANWPVHIKLLSSSISAADCTSTLNSIKNGNTDIIIATHKILSGKASFANLGLLIIDEEHRFGVSHKEKLKNLKLNVDVIALTATPIPRTLQLACTNLRDLSIIATPPQERLPIQTYISSFSDKIIIEAVTREINRGGQVYYLYNEVAKINIMAEHLQQLLPDIRIVVAHGQMPKARLAQAMTRFYQKRAELCLCSTIVESGIDIPNANTIIIDRADKLGLAQLHQIRGRVGRSNHQAYAYLFTLDKKLLNTDAKQRLAAISKHNSLGSGFQLAILDMEIRGAGELLGNEQSGHIKELGFDYYISLINDTTSAIKDNKEVTTALELQCKVDINTSFPIIIPESYIPNPATRLQIYKKLSSIKSDDTKFSLKNELEDIHSKPPESCLNLIEINHLRYIATQSNIKTINFNANDTEIIFSSNPSIDTEKLIDLVSKHPETYKIKGSTKLEIKHQSKTPYLQIENTSDFLKHISV